MKNIIMIFLLTNSLTLSISAMDDKLSSWKRPIDESAQREYTRKIEERRQVSSKKGVLSKRQSSEVTGAKSDKPKHGGTH